MDRQTDTGHVGNQGTTAGDGLHYRAATYGTTIDSDCRDLAIVDVDTRNFGKLMQFDTALAGFARISPHHRIVPGCRTITMPQTGQYRVLRGGSFNFEPRFLRSANRLSYEPELRFAFIGFRCVRGSVRQLVD